VIDARGKYCFPGEPYCEIYATLSPWNPDLMKGTVALVVTGDEKLWRFRAPNLDTIEAPYSEFPDIDAFMLHVKCEVAKFFAAQKLNYEPPTPWWIFWR